ncbi:hypothetical protein J6590_072704 [Homalodisca vitripennis]|nr:hypothetical protein J6590_072704 [Homalodisca vitripennis]
MLSVTLTPITVCGDNGVFLAEQQTGEVGKQGLLARYAYISAAELYIKQSQQRAELLAHLLHYSARSRVAQTEGCGSLTFYSVTWLSLSRRVFSSLPLLRDSVEDADGLPKPWPTEANVNRLRLIQRSNESASYFPTSTESAGQGTVRQVYSVSVMY